MKDHISRLMGFQVGIFRISPIKFSSIVFLILCSERFLSSVHDEYTPEMTVAEKRSGGNYKL